MTIDVIQTHTTTGAKTAVGIPTAQNVNISVTANGTFTADVEVLLATGGTFVVAVTGVTGSIPVVIASPVQSVRINISAFGTATTLDFEVLSGSQ